MGQPHQIPTRFGSGGSSTLFSCPSPPAGGTCSENRGPCSEVSSACFEDSKNVVIFSKRWRNVIFLSKTSRYISKKDHNCICGTIKEVSPHICHGSLRFGNTRGSPPQINQWAPLCSTTFDLESPSFDYVRLRPPSALKFD